MFLKNKYDHINSGFRLFKDLKISHIKHASVFDGLKIHYYPEEVHRRFYYCYIPPLVLCGDLLNLQILFLSAKHPHQWGIVKLAIYKCVA